MAAPTEPSASETPRPSPAAAIVSVGWLGSQSMFADTSHQHGKRAAGATLASLALHGLLLLLAVLFFSYKAQIINLPESMELPRLVYLQQPGPGGGGGGSPAPAPPKAIEIPRSKPPEPIPFTPVPPPPVIPPPMLSAPIMTPDANLAQATGSSSVSLAAYGGGGRGTGIGSGTGSGVGPGEGGGFGGGAYKPGAGISDPVLLKKVNPTYTSEAMRAKIQGSVELEAVILADGTVGPLRVRKSLDRTNGLDQAAMDAAKQWLFKPAVNREGRPVDLLVTLVVDFRIF